MRPTVAPFGPQTVECNDTRVCDWIITLPSTAVGLWLRGSVTSRPPSQVTAPMSRVGVAARWVIGDPRDRSVEALGRGIPGRLLKRLAKAGY